jgi:hypothetical protein
MGLKRVRKRFDPEDIARFRNRQRRVEYQPDPMPQCALSAASRATVST